MKVNYVLMYGIPYVRYKEFETFEDISKFLINKGIVNYSIFKKLEDKEEVEMIYRDNDIRFLENIIKEVREYINSHLYMESTGGIQHPTFDGKMNRDTDGFEILEILDKEKE